MALGIAVAYWLLITVANEVLRDAGMQGENRLTVSIAGIGMLFALVKVSKSKSVRKATVNGLDYDACRACGFERWMGYGECQKCGARLA